MTRSSSSESATNQATELAGSAVRIRLAPPLLRDILRDNHLPYSVQTNDVPAYFEMKVSVPEFEATLRRQFDTL